MYTLIFSGGTVTPGQALNQAIASADLIIAADKGAATALHYGCTPAIVVGDFDSLAEPILQQLRTAKSQIIQAPVEKDETDTELAVNIALEHGATTITLLGGLGGSRFDHTMANILLLADFDIVPLRIIDGPTVCWLLRGPTDSAITGNVGDLLSLFPLTTDATEVSTDGLYYPLHSETLRFGKPRGVSNYLTRQQASVSLATGLLLVIHTNIQELHED